jgi:hypothetical protein
VQGTGSWDRRPDVLVTTAVDKTNLVRLLLLVKNRCNTADADSQPIQ